MLTNTKQYKNSRTRRNRKDAISPRMLLMPVDKIRSYATVEINLLQNEAERIAEAVDRKINVVADEANSLGTKTTAI